MKTNPKPSPKTNYPSTQTLPTITVGLKHLAFDDIPEVEQHQPTNNISTTAPVANQNGGGTSSTQTNGANPHQSPPQAPSLAPVIQCNTEPDKVQV
jgi:hypothetical protein